MNGESFIGDGGSSIPDSSLIIDISPSIKEASTSDVNFGGSRCCDFGTLPVRL